MLDGEVDQRDTLLTIPERDGGMMLVCVSRAAPGAERCATIGDAISLHLNSRVSPEHGPEAQALQAGAGVDVIGLRLWELSRSTVDAVMTRYPLLNHIDGLPFFAAEAHPHTRTQLLTRWLMFMTMARRNPLAKRYATQGLST